MTPKTYKIVWEDGDNGSFRGEVVALADYEVLVKVNKEQEVEIAILRRQRNKYVNYLEVPVLVEIKMLEKEIANAKLGIK